MNGVVVLIVEIVVAFGNSVVLVPSVELLLVAGVPLSGESTTKLFDSSAIEKRSCSKVQQFF